MFSPNTSSSTVFSPNLSSLTVPSPNTLTVINAFDYMDVTYKIHLDQRAFPMSAVKNGESKTVGYVIFNPCASNNSAVTNDEPPINGFVCKICNSRLKNKQSLSNHMTGHRNYNSGKYTCTICDRKFSRRSTLNEHKGYFHGQDEFLKFQCEICCKKFPIRSHWITHEKGCKKNYQGTRERKEIEKEKKHDKEKKKKTRKKRNRKRKRTTQGKESEKEQHKKKKAKKNNRRK